jgi:hypothetical protein
MEESINSFIRSVRDGDIVLIFFSGHGCEYEGVNYLLPIDYPIHSNE